MRTLCLIMVLVLVGCATKPSAIMPPKIKVPKSVAVGKSMTHFTLYWEDCKEQPTNVWYRVYESVDLKNRTLYAQLTNEHSLVIPTTHARAFYTIEVTNGEKSRMGSKECE